MLKNANISLTRELSIEEIRQIISKINEYFFTNYDGIGTTHILGEDFKYFSEFHKFWETYHAQVLNPIIDEDKCKAAAEVLHTVYTTFGEDLFYELYDTYTLAPEEVSKIRYFSANQDFRGSRNFDQLARSYAADPTIFDVENINSHPEDFVRNIGATSLSQNDKRVKYATVSSQILLDRELEPYDLLDYFDRDIIKIREFLTSQQGAGFGNKKTDMFLRDMVVLGIWNDVTNFDKIDVASDVNTVKVALRAGILKTDIVLLSSFLDIFCYQYSLIDEMAALAWRTVWKYWNANYPTECIESPCLIDYFVYRIIGKEFCKEKLCTFQCEVENHIFKWHSSQNRTCQLCWKERKIKNRARVIKKVLPCTDEHGYLVIQNTKFVKGAHAQLPNIKGCPFIPVCNPQSTTFKSFNPPKSISILGRTGWESAKTRDGLGGGGLMS